MNRYLIPAFILFLASCGGPTDETGEVLNNDTDTSGEELVEYELDERRLNSVDFNNELSITMESAVGSVDVLFSSDSSNIDLNLDNAIFEMEMNLHKLEGIVVVGEGDAFKDAVIGLVSFYLEEFNGGFKAIVPIIKKEELTKSEEGELDAYDLQFADNERTLSDLIFEEQEAYALANNIKLSAE